jgi:DNA (cytosine-5)-methyltransferase 1
MVEIESNRHNWTFPPIVSKPRTDHTSDLTVVDLFSGPGGISEGFKQSGFTPVFGVDIHEPSIETYKSNNPTAGTILGVYNRFTVRYKRVYTSS